VRTYVSVCRFTMPTLKKYRFETVALKARPLSKIFRPFFAPIKEEEEKSPNQSGVNEEKNLNQEISEVKLKQVLDNSLDKKNKSTKRKANHPSSSSSSSSSSSTSNRSSDLSQPSQIDPVLLATQSERPSPPSQPPQKKKKIDSKKTKAKKVGPKKKSIFDNYI